MPKTFFSYSRSDADFTRKLATDLRSAGADLWIDQLDIQPGVRWDEAIEAALRESETLLVILSPRAVASQNIMDEVSYALEQSKAVIPVIMEPCELPFRLKRLQYISFVEGYEAGLRRLCDVLRLKEDLGITGLPLTKDPPMPSPGNGPLARHDEQGRKGRKLPLPVIIAAVLVVLLLLSYMVYRSSSGMEETAGGATDVVGTADMEETPPAPVAGVYQSAPVAGKISLFRIYPGIRMIIFEHGIDDNEEAVQSAISALMKEHVTEYQYSIDGNAIRFDVGTVEEDGSRTIAHYKGNFDGADSTMNLIWSNDEPETGLVSYDLRWVSAGE